MLGCHLSVSVIIWSLFDPIVAIWVWFGRYLAAIRIVLRYVGVSSTLFSAISSI